MKEFAGYGEVERGAWPETVGVHGVRAWRVHLCTRASARLCA